MKPKRLMTIPGLESRMPTAISELKSIARTKTTTRSAAQRPPLEVSTALTIRATTSIGCPTGPPLWFNNEANPHIRALSSFSFVLKANYDMSDASSMLFVNIYICLKNLFSASRSFIHICTLFPLFARFSIIIHILSVKDTLILPIYTNFPELCKIKEIN